MYQKKIWFGLRSNFKEEKLILGTIGKSSQPTLSHSYSSTFNYPTKRSKLNDEDSVSSTASKRSSSDSESCVDSEDESDNDNSASSNEGKG